MALVEKYHVVAAVKAVNTSSTIKEGQIVSLAADGTVTLCNVLGVYPTPYGIAGDTKSTSASAMPGIASGWQNRVSDYFDETKASAKMTVYHSGGEFATDQFSSNVSAAALMDPLYCNSGLFCTAAESTNSGIVARLTADAAAYPSGVPGVDTATYDATTYVGDQALGGDNSNTYIEFKLVI